MKRSKTTDTKHNKKQKLSKISEECKIIDSINITKPKSIIQTPCGKFLIGVEGHSIFKYNLKTKQKFRIAGSVEQSGYQDGTRDESRFHWPYGLTLSKDLKTLFVTDDFNRVIRAICVVTGMTTTFAGQVGKRKCVDGPKEKACFANPRILKLSPDGNTLIVADYAHFRTICIETGQVDTIVSFGNAIRGFSLSPDSKHVYISIWKQNLKYNLETGESEIILEDKGFEGCELSKNGQLLFIPNFWHKCQVVNLDTNTVINTINTSFPFLNISITTNEQQLYVSRINKIQVLDISKYCTNFKIFLKSQLAKHSFLPPQVIKTCSI
jgi:hypothetical protein